MTDTPRIVLDPAILLGKPLIRGTRVSVEFVLGLLAQGWTAEDVVADYPPVTREDVLACLAYARDAIQGERVFPSAA